MSWVIKIISRNQYVYSGNVFVENPEFARIFLTRRQALAYIKTCNLLKSDVAIITHKRSSKGLEAAERVICAADKNNGSSIFKSLN